MAEASRRLALPQIRRSSANKSEWIEGQFGPKEIPSKELRDMASCNTIESLFNLLQARKDMGREDVPALFCYPYGILQTVGH